MRYHAVNTAGFRITYGLDGTGTTSGSAMVNTILNGSSASGYTQRYVNTDDYRNSGISKWFSYYSQYISIQSSFKLKVIICFENYKIH